MEENKLDKRSIARIQAMKIIYIADFNGISIDSSLTMGKSGFFNDNIAGEDPISEETIELMIILQVKTLFQRRQLNY